MQLMLLEPGRAAVPADAASFQTEHGYYWLDVETSETHWYRDAAGWLDAKLLDHHLLDSLNGEHRPFYDGTDEYDLLVLRSLDQASPAEAPNTRPVAIFITAKGLISIRPAGDRVFERLGKRLLAGQRKAPPSPVAFLGLLVNQVVGLLLDHREAVSDLVDQWQDRLLAEEGLFEEWQSLSRLRNRLRRLESVSEDQLDALSAWREQTSREIDSVEEARFDEISKDLRRIFDHVATMQADIDSLLQIHYAAMGQRTNEILRFLTVISAVFLPLNLIASLFGMNFTHMPFIDQGSAPAVTVGLMVLLAMLLLYILREKRWF